ncbi:MAG: TetR/AcrR family transcriptional regulator [bacterium]
MADIEQDNISEQATIGSRDLILAAATAEFSNLGFAGARVDRIARTAGVNKAMIYYHFTSKRELYRACLEDLMSRKATDLKAAFDADASLETALAGLADAYVSLFAGDPQGGRLLLRALAERDADSIDRLADAMRSSGLPQHVTSKLVQGMTAGHLRPVDVRQAMVSFVVMNVGYFILSPLVNRVLQIDDPVEFIQNRKAAVVDLFLNGVKAK